MSTPLHQLQLAIRFIERAIETSVDLPKTTELKLKKLKKESAAILKEMALAQSKTSKPKASPKKSKSKTSPKIEIEIDMEKFWNKVEKGKKEAANDFVFYNIDTNKIVKLQKDKKPVGKALQKNWWLFHVPGKDGFIGLCGTDTAKIHAIMDELLGDCEGDYFPPVWGPDAKKDEPADDESEAESDGETESVDEDSDAINEATNKFFQKMEKALTTRYPEDEWQSTDRAELYYNVDSGRIITVKPGKKPGNLTMNWYWFEANLGDVAEDVSMGLCGKDSATVNLILKGLFGSDHWDETKPKWGPDAEEDE